MTRDVPSLATDASASANTPQFETPSVPVPTSTSAHATVTRRPGAPPTVTIKNVVIGSGRPKVVVPITATDPDEALSMARKIGESPAADLAEFRIDYLPDDMTPETVATLCRAVRDTLLDKPLLVTFRSQKEGGERAIASADYEALYCAVLAREAADLIDLEMMLEPACLARLRHLAKQYRVAVVMSKHYFHETPATSVLIDRLREQQEMGADILKIATMPNTPGDTLRLMQATWEMASRYAHRPLLSMSMGADGVVSRLSGELTGSALSYGSIGAASAPGQLKAIDLHRVLSIIHASADA